MLLRSNSGNVLFLILIAVALFAALSYVIINSSRMGTGSTQAERARLDAALLDNYTASINTGLLKLSLRACETIDYTPPSGWGAGSKKCFLFHPDGGGVIYQDLDLGDGSCRGTAKPWTQLAIGESCGVMTYAGSYGGKRMYTTIADIGMAQWKTTATSTTTAVLIAAGLYGTGVSTIDTTVAAQHPAAALCRTVLGMDWQLPTRDELPVIYSERNTGVISGTFTAARYWTISQNGAANNFTVDFGTGVLTGQAKTNTYRVRCIRYD